MTDGFYVIGLSAVDPDMQLNEQLLKGRSWFYIPIVHTNGGRAILAMEKGPPGDRAFAEAFAAAWEKNNERREWRSPQSGRPIASKPESPAVSHLSLCAIYRLS